ncbi:MAG: diphosphate--fructose-6-phosphate 1-phosphotransferase [Peptoniphilaceae bacterium]|nr:diphosphate--fructose-6-phosphate 1-phosphotransferase [Peptoniphilaceae bacterium]
MNVLIGQSGGPTSVINSSLAGVISSAIEHGFDHIYGMENGIAGLIEGRICQIDKKIYTEKNIEDKLKSEPAAILGSCRYKLPEDLSDFVYEKIFQTLEKFQISSLIYIGGNDSMDTVVKLNKYIEKNRIAWLHVIGIPKTIDNDLREMDHSPGFGSAAKYVATALNLVRTDVNIYNVKSVTFVEIMGRNAGWLAASALLSNYKKKRKTVNLLYLKEVEKTKEDILSDIKEAFKYENNLVIALSEGFMDKDGFFAKEDKKSYDQAFGHPVISGIGEKLSNFVAKELGVKSRSVELNILQRTSFLISKQDSKEAFELGYKGLEKSISQTNLVPVIKRKEKETYEYYIDFVDPLLIANKEKYIPKAWLESYRVLEDKIIAYGLPLIQGQVEEKFDKGMISFIGLDDFTKKAY